MNLNETARALALVQSFDRRTVGEADVVAWRSVLTDVALADAEEAIRRHYAEQTDWLMPAHIRRYVRDIVREREALASATGWAPGQAGVPKDQAVPEISGPVRAEDLPSEVLDLVTRIRAILPEGSREALHPRRVAWEREQRAYVRTRDAQPNPLYAHAHPAAKRRGCDRHEKSGRGFKWDCQMCNPRAGKCDLCGADSGDLAEHVADYPNGSCV
jgi:hypothetical protein